MVRWGFERLLIDNPFYWIDCTLYKLTLETHIEFFEIHHSVKIILFQMKIV